jgi:hypothetical protein
VLYHVTKASTKQRAVSPRGVSNLCVFWPVLHRLGGINPYVFTGDDPIGGRDPSGLDPCLPCRMSSRLTSGGTESSLRHEREQFVSLVSEVVADLISEWGLGTSDPVARVRRQ